MANFVFTNCIIGEKPSFIYKESASSPKLKILLFLQNFFVVRYYFVTLQRIQQRMQTYLLKFHLESPPRTGKNEQNDPIKFGAHT